MVVRFLAAGVLLFPIGVGYGPAAAQDTGIPSEVRNALERNASRLGPVTVKTRHQMVAPRSPEATLATLRVRESASLFFQRFDTTTIWDQGRLYVHSTRDFGDSGSGPERESSFDGATLYIGDPGGNEGPQLGMHEPSRLRSHERYLRTEYLEAAGYNLSLRAGEMAAGIQVSPLILVQLDNGALLRLITTAEIDGAPVLRIDIDSPDPERQRAEAINIGELERDLRAGRNPESYIQDELAAVRTLRALPEHRRYVFFLDPAHGYALRRMEQRREGDLLLSIDNTDFMGLGRRGVWLPRASTTQFWSFPTRPGVVFSAPVARREIRVLELADDRVPKSRFVLTYDTPGSYIIDNVNYDQAITYTVPASLEQLEQAIEEARARVPGGAQPVRIAKPKWLRAILINTAAVLVVIVLVVIWRKVRW